MDERSTRLELKKIDANNFDDVTKQISSNGFVLTKYQNIDLDDNEDLNNLKKIIKLKNIKF